MLTLLNKTNILDGLGGLLSLEFMRDAKIVCKDGSLRWSALLLSQWSEVARDQLSEQSLVCADYPLTIVAKHVHCESMEKLLAWTLRGKISSNEAERSELSEILVALKAQVAFSKQDMNYSDPRAENAGESAALKRKKTDKNGNLKKRKVSDKEVEGKKVSHDKKTIFCCPLCPKKSDVISHLIEHVANSHYKRKIFKFWGSKDLSDPCLTCGKRFAEGRSRERTIYRHLIGHGYLYQVPNLDPKVKEMLDSTKHYGKRCQSDVNVKLGEIYDNCLACKQCNFDYGTLKTHIAQMHCPEKVSEQFDQDTESCKICQTKVMPIGNDVSYSAVQHIVDKHPYEMKSIVPHEINQVFMNCLDETRSCLCPVCFDSFPDPHDLRTHLCRTHFRQDLLREFNSDEVQTCSLCDYDCGTRQSSKRTFNMARHIGLTHSKLEDVLPVDVREKVEAMVAAESVGKKKDDDDDESDDEEFDFQEETNEEEERGDLKEDALAKKVFVKMENCLDND